jgi:hypothetical protein
MAFEACPKNWFLLVSNCPDPANKTLRVHFPSSINQADALQPEIFSARTRR